MFELEQNIFQSLSNTITIFTKFKWEAYLVGGFVRDFLLTRKTNDIDIAVRGNSLEIAQQLAKEIEGHYVLLDAVNNVARVIAPGNRDHIYLDISGYSNNILDDLSRRDFTIDAIGIKLETWNSSELNIIDPFSGQIDLKKGIIRAVNQLIFKHDPARLLRAVRLAAVLGFQIENKTEVLITEQAKLVGKIPGERLREEFLKVLSMPDAAKWLIYCDELGLLTQIIPELVVLKGVEQPKEHYWDVFNHSLETIATIEFLLRQNEWSYNNANLLAVVPWSAEISEHFEENISSDSRRIQLMKLAALLHDIAKPATKNIDKVGRMRFLGHPKLGAEMGNSIVDRLRFGNKEKKYIEMLIYNHLRPAQLTHEDLPTKRAIYRYFRDTKGAGIDIIFLALADYLAARGPEIDINDWYKYNNMFSYVLNEHAQQDEETKTRKLVDGHDLINIFGLKPGPVIGKLLSQIHEAEATSKISTREEAFRLIQKKLKKNTMATPITRTRNN